ncbi:unnamed protein product [Tilletia controversa]|nr:unnamed protein product [Tilletia controversa]
MASGDVVGDLALRVMSAAIRIAADDQPPTNGGGGGDGGGDGNGGGGHGHGPLPTDKAYQGPWFSQQVELSLFIGLLSLLIFSALRRRLTVIFAPRTRLIQFAPLKDHPDLDIASAVQQGSIFSWILPTLRAPDDAILHLVGLDAHILLQFHKMGFWLLLAFAGWSTLILMPINYLENGHIDGVAPSEDGFGRNHTSGNATFLSLFASSFATFTQPVEGVEGPEGPLPYLPSPSPSPSTTAYHLTHFITTYLFTLLTLRFLHTNYVKYIKARQLYALGVLDSIPARTIEIRDLPPHLRDDRALTDYFERMGLMVESTAVVRHSGELSKLLKQRADALSDLERAWCKWLGNPTTAKNYDPDEIVKTFRQRQAAHIRTISMGNGHTPRRSTNDNHDHEATPLLSDSRDAEPITTSESVTRIELPEHKERPKMRTSAYNPFSAKIDTLDEFERRFRKLDAAVWKVRGNIGTNSGYADPWDGLDGDAEDDAGQAQGGAKDDDEELDFRKGGRPRIRFRAGAVGFVTFVKASSAQIAAQVQHYPLPAQCRTLLAPEPRDIIWSNISLSPHERRLRQLLVSAFVFGLLLFYIPPLTFLASFLSPQAIEKYMPWLAQLLEKSPTLRALVMNNASAILVASFNGLLPMALEWSGYLQGLRARSLIEYSVLKKYYLFLVVSVIFVFLVTSTAWGVLSDLANNPMRSLDKIAALLPGARNFSLAYVIFQALAIVPLSLLQLPYVLNRGWARMWTLTPREHAELNVPPMLYMGTVYPQALIIFTLSVLYGIVSPLLPIFGAIYFGGAYLVNKYKLIFVFYKSYESKGQAYPLSAQRMVFSLLLFQVFQFSLFSVRKQFIFSTLILPLLFGTFWYGRHLARTFAPLSEFVNLQSVREMEAQGVHGDIDAAGTGLDGGQTPGQAEQAGYAAGDELLPGNIQGGVPVSKSKVSPNSAKLSTQTATVPREAVDPTLSLTSSPSAAVIRSQMPGRRALVKDETLFVAAKDSHTDYREPPAGNYFPGVLNTGRRRYGHPAATGVLPHLWLPIPAEGARRRTQSLDALEAGEYEPVSQEASTDDNAQSSDALTATGANLQRTRTVSGAPSASAISSTTSGPGTRGGGDEDDDGRNGDSVVLSLRRRKSLFRRRSLFPPLKGFKKATPASGGEATSGGGMSRSKTVAAAIGPGSGSGSGSGTVGSSPLAQKRASTGDLKAAAAASAEGSGSSSAAPGVGAGTELLVDTTTTPTPTSTAEAVARVQADLGLPPLSGGAQVAEPEEAVDDEEDEDEDEDAEEGVYIHRRSMSGATRAGSSTL